MKKHKKLIIVLVVVLILLILFFFLRRGASEGGAFGMTSATVGSRDITTYHTFTGTIAPVDEKNIYPDLTGLKISQVNVEEGDSVKAGDVLFLLDSDSLEESIREKEASMASASKSADLALRQAQTNYSNYKKNLDEGLNASVLQAQSSMDSAYSALLSAQQSYDNEVALNNQGLSSAILNAQSSVSSAYNAVKSAQDSLDKGIGSQSSVDSAMISYNTALQSYEAAKQNEENTLTKLYDSLITAQNSYLSAVDSYNAVVRSTSEQLQTYAYQLESAQLGTDTTLSDLQLADLKRQLEDCIITAPLDGVVTAVNVKEGDSVTGATALAVITNFDKLQVNININEYDILGASEGSPVEIIVSALDKSYEGEITHISKTAKISSGVSYFESEIQFDADEDARSGMSVEVKLMINDLKQVIAIPSEAIQTAEDGTAYVNMMGSDGKTMEQHTISLGVSDGSYTQITEGLSEGDVIYYTPSFGGITFTID
ncbi:MAG: efflux RND transporter periplasmic adaptor subunit [Lachnospiraceae bacterium]|nr:efflux RND transporter periplasmic adaptor subunit [Lachnospiraceae bacterium]